MKNLIVFLFICNFSNLVYASEDIKYEHDTFNFSLKTYDDYQSNFEVSASYEPFFNDFYSLGFQAGLGTLRSYEGADEASSVILGALITQTSQTNLGAKTNLNFGVQLFDDYEDYYFQVEQGLFTRIPVNKLSSSDRSIEFGVGYKTFMSEKTDKTLREKITICIHIYPLTFNRLKLIFWDFLFVHKLIRMRL